MKKIFKKSNIFSFILGAVIFGGIVGVSAYTILANDIGYTPSDTTWKKSNGEDITNVKDAIDELYTKANENNCVYGTYTKRSNQQMNILFDFDPSYFVAYFTPDTSFVKVKYESNTLTATNNTGVNMDSYFEKINTSIVSTYPTDFNSYKNSYEINYIACK